MDWDLQPLGISKEAWDKVIHRGIKPVIVFAHPDLLNSISGSTGYYRMLSMVSQKSMNQVGLSVTRYESGKVNPSHEASLAISCHLNRIISQLVELAEKIDPREFDLWRGMAAGTQAQGSWQNTKGNKAEVIINGILQQRIRESGLVSEESDNGKRLQLTDGRIVEFSDEPDIAIYRSGKIHAAVEIKGGIDKASALERVGAAIKSLSRAKDENPRSKTILILQEMLVTNRAKEDLRTNRHAVNRWMTIEDILESAIKREKIFKLLGI